MLLALFLVVLVGASSITPNVDVTDTATNVVIGANVSVVDPASPAASPIASVTATSSAAPSESPIASVTPSESLIASVTATSSAAPSKSPLSVTPEPSSSAFATATSTAFATATSTPFPSSSPSLTPSGTPTLTPSQTSSQTGSPSPSASTTSALTSTSSRTQTPTESSSATTTPTPTNSATPSLTSTTSSTLTSTQSATQSATVTPSATNSVASSQSQTASLSRTQTSSSTLSSTSSSTASPSQTQSSTASRTRSVSSSPTATSTLSNSATASRTGSPTQTATSTNSRTATGSATETPTSTKTRSNSPSASASNEVEIRESSSTTPTSSPTASGSDSFSPTISASASPSPVTAVGEFQSASFVDLEGDGSVIGGDLTFSWRQISGAFPAAFQVGVVNQDGTNRILVPSFTANLDALTRGSQIRIELNRIQLSQGEVSSGSVSLMLAATNGPFVLVLTPDLVVDQATAVVTVAATSVAVIAVSTAAASVTGTVAGSAAASAAAATTTTTTTAATTATTGGSVTGGSVTGGGSAVSGGGGTATAAAQVLPTSLLIGQLQFMGMNSYQTGYYPRGLRELNKSFEWANFNLGFPNRRGDGSTNSGEKSLKLQIVEQLPGYLRYSPEKLLENTIFVLGALFAILIVVAGVYTILKRNSGKPSFLRRTKARPKLLSLGMRVIHVGAFGLVFASINQLKSGSSPIHHVIAAVILVCVVIGLPLAYLTVFLVNTRSVHPPLRFLGFVVRLCFACQPLMEDFEPRRAWFVLPSVVKGLLASMSLALFTDPMPQSILMLTIYVVYFALLTVQPYRSRLVLQVDILMSLIDCTTLCVPVVFHFYPRMSRRSTEVQWTLIALELTVVLLYTLFTSLLLLRQIASLARSFKSAEWSATKLSTGILVEYEDDAYQGDKLHRVGAQQTKSDLESHDTLIIEESPHIPSRLYVGNSPHLEPAGDVVHK